ncbi:MAG: acyl-CoA dehydrogenase family protein [Myxococcales bacterium]|nr:acyl-CoA dehydrogenase family protein [Myxococcales bacterium]
MEFRLSDDQLALREGVRAFCTDRVPNEAFVGIEEKGGFDRALWGEVAEMGVFSLRLSEDEGGVGLGMADAVIVFAELGRRVVPGPLVWTHLAAGLVDGADTGAAVVGGIDLTGGAESPVVVEYLPFLDALLVLRDDGVHRIDPKAVVGTPIATPLDPLTPVHAVSALPAGERIGDAALAERMRRDGAVLASGFLLGIAEATLELANDYAKTREQFNRPIGSFQAIKHMLADMFVRQEVARAAAYAAGATVDHPEAGDLAAAVSGAKINCGEAAMKNARACIQIHGGMGYTWEVPAHYYLKRTWVLENAFGGVDEHAEVVAERVAARTAA